MLVFQSLISLFIDFSFFFIQPMFHIGDDLPTSDESAELKAKIKVNCILDLRLGDLQNVSLWSFTVRGMDLWSLSIY